MRRQRNMAQMKKNRRNLHKKNKTKWRQAIYQMESSKHWIYRGFMNLGEGVDELRENFNKETENIKSGARKQKKEPVRNEEYTN